MGTRRISIIAAVIFAVAGAIAAVSLELGKSELDEVRAATEVYQSVAAAEAAGFVNVNVGEYVASPEGAMGYHSVNFDRVELELDPQEPEIMVFVPGADSELRLGVVECALPIEPWRCHVCFTAGDAWPDATPEPGIGAVCAACMALRGESIRCLC